VFEIEAVDLQAITKVVVGHDGKEPGSGWFLDQVVVYAPGKSGYRQLTFKCNR
jgi:hypothetical protein